MLFGFLLEFESLPKLKSRHNSINEPFMFARSHLSDMLGLPPHPCMPSRPLNDVIMISFGVTQFRANGFCHMIKTHSFLLCMFCANPVTFGCDPVKV